MKLLIKASNGDKDLEVVETIPIEFGTVITIEEGNLSVSRLGRPGLQADLTCEDVVTVSVIE